MGEKIDDQKNRFDFEICLLIEAGTAVSNKRHTTAAIRNPMMMDKYVNLVRILSTDDFVSPSIRDDVCVKLFHGERGEYTGGKLRWKFEDCLKEIRIQYTQTLPRDISNDPS